MDEAWLYDTLVELNKIESCPHCKPHLYSHQLSKSNPKPEFKLLDELLDYGLFVPNDPVELPYR